MAQKTALYNDADSDGKFSSADALLAADLLVSNSQLLCLIIDTCKPTAAAVH